MKICFAMISLFFCISVNAQKNKSSIFDKNNWVEFIGGDMPLVISVPHGGTLTVDSLPVRDCAGAITGVDIKTIELSRAIQAYIKQQFNMSPYIVISHIARKHIDQNRELTSEEATCGHRQSEKAWYSFHNLVDSALNLATSRYQRVMFVDLHGHSHANQRIEVGYNITWGELNKILAGTFSNPEKVHALSNLMKLEKDFNLKEMLFGDLSLGTLLANQGLKVTPSKQDLVPQRGEAYFSGGDNTRRFTSERYPNVFGLQLECDRTARLDGNRLATAKGISEALVQYLNLYAKANIKK